MQKIFTFSLKTIITRWEETAIINCENDEEFIRLIKSQKVVMNLLLPAKIIKVRSRKAWEDGEDPKRTTLYQPGYYKKKDFDN